MANSQAVVASPFDDPMAAVGARQAVSATAGSPQGGLGTTNSVVVTDIRSALAPDKPLVWALGVIGVTFGLVFASTSIRFGPFRAAASVGKSKEDSDK